MNIIFKILLFSLVLNVAVGMMMEIVPHFKGDGIFAGNKQGLDYLVNGTTRFTQDAEGLLGPANAEDTSTALDRFLDQIGVSMFKKIKNFINQYMYGFTASLRLIFKATPGSSTKFVLDSINVIITIAYVIGGIWLFTGKKLTGR